MEMTKKLLPLFCATAILLLVNNKAYSQLTPCCSNAGFEDTTFTGWQAWTGTAPSPVWTVSSPSSQNNTMPGTGYTGRHSLWFNGSSQIAGCYYPNTPLQLNPCMTTIGPGGGNVSAILGNTVTGYGAERLSYQMVVDSCNMGFYYSYAILLNDGGHDSLGQPSFWVQILDSNGTQVTGPCGSYVVAVGYNDSGFITNPSSAPSPFNPMKYL